MIWLKRRLERRPAELDVSRFACSPRLLALRPPTSHRFRQCESRELANHLAATFKRRRVMCFLFAPLADGTPDVLPPFDALENQVVEVHCIRGAGSDPSRGAVLTPTLAQIFRACHMIDYWLALRGDHVALLIGGESFPAPHLALFAAAHRIYTDSGADVETLLAEIAATEPAPLPLPHASRDALLRFAQAVRCSPLDDAQCDGDSAAAAAALLRSFEAPPSVRITSIVLRRLAVERGDEEPPTLFVLLGDAVVFSSAEVAPTSSDAAAADDDDDKKGLSRRDFVFEVNALVRGDFAIVCAEPAPDGSRARGALLLSLTRHTACMNEPCEVHPLAMLDPPTEGSPRARGACLEMSVEFPDADRDNISDSSPSPAGSSSSSSLHAFARGAEGVKRGQAAVSAMHIVRPENDAFRELLRLGRSAEKSVYALQLADNVLADAVAMLDEWGESDAGDAEDAEDVTVEGGDDAADTTTTDVVARELARRKSSVKFDDAESLERDIARMRASLARSKEQTGAHRETRERRLVAEDMIDSMRLRGSPSASKATALLHAGNFASIEIAVARGRELSGKAPAAAAAESVAGRAAVLPCKDEAGIQALVASSTTSGDGSAVRVVVTTATVRKRRPGAAAAAAQMLAMLNAVEVATAAVSGAMAAACEADESVDDAEETMLMNLVLDSEEAAALRSAQERVTQSVAAWDDLEGVDRFMDLLDDSDDEDDVEGAAVMISSGWDLQSPAAAATEATNLVQAKRDFELANRDLMLARFSAQKRFEAAKQQAAAAVASASASVPSVEKQEKGEAADEDVAEKLLSAVVEEEEEEEEEESAVLGSTQLEPLPVAVGHGHAAALSPAAEMKDTSAASEIVAIPQMPTMAPMLTTMEAPPSAVIAPSAAMMLPAMPPMGAPMPATMPPIGAPVPPVPPMGAMEMPQDGVAAPPLPAMPPMGAPMPAMPPIGASMPPMGGMGAMGMPPPMGMPGMPSAMGMPMPMPIPVPLTAKKKKASNVQVRRIRWSPCNETHASSDSPQIWDASDDDNDDDGGGDHDGGESGGGHSKDSAHDGMAVRGRAETWDDDEMKALFVQKKKSVKARSKAAGGKKSAKRAIEPGISLDGKRAMGVGLAVAKLRLKNPERLAKLAQGIARLDLSNLGYTEDDIEALIPLIPDAFETKQVLAFTGSASDLDEAAGFFYAVVHTFPTNAVMKLRSIRFMTNFVDESAGADEQVTLMTTCTREVRGSVKLKRVLGLVLKLGNKLNKLAGIDDVARGFSLASLAALSTTKGFDGKTTMLSYLESLITQKKGELLDFNSEVPSLASAARELSLPTLKAGIATLQRGAKELDACVLRCSADLGEEAEVALAMTRKTAALIHASIAALETRCASAERDYSKLLNYLAQDADLAPSELFETIAAFGASFDAAHAKNDELRARRARLKAQREERAQKKEARSALKTSKLAAAAVSSSGASCPAEAEAASSGSSSSTSGGGVTAALAGEPVAGVRDRKGVLLSLDAHVAVKTKRMKLKGTIKFIGKTSFQKGVWLGIEVSEGSEEFGRHNGAVDGKTYFRTAKKRGLFARPMWVTLLSSTGAGAGDATKKKKKKTTTTSGTAALRSSMALRRALLESDHRDEEVGGGDGGWDD